MQQINHGISTGALFLIVGVLYERRHTCELRSMAVFRTSCRLCHDHHDHVPLVDGTPLLNGFVGNSAFCGNVPRELKWAAWAVPGVVLAAAYLLWLYQRVFFGQVTNPKNEKLHDLNSRELLCFAPLIIAAFWIGLYPKPFFEILEQPVNQLVHSIRPDYPLEVKDVNASAAPVAAPPVVPETTKGTN